jgi:alditol oxidase
LPHFRLESTLTGGNELQSEYFVPRKAAVAALRAVATLGDAMAPFLVASEVRSVAADDLWLSPFYGEAGIGIHFSWYNRWAEVEQFLPRLENALAPYAARPHWGKLFTMPPAQVQAHYARLPDFQRLAQRYDRTGKFRNAFLERYLLPVY